jgi:Flp pilus assembly protein TadG
MSTLLMRLRTDKRGTSLLELALVLPVLTLVLVGAIDLGRVFYATAEVANAAHAGAEYGARTVSLATDTAGMKQVAANDAVDVSGITTTASSSCSCTSIQGSGLSVACPSAASICGSNSPFLVYVTVTTSKSLVPMFPWPKVPNPITVSASATMRAK